MTTTDLLASGKNMDADGTCRPLLVGPLLSQSLCRVTLERLRSVPKFNLLC